jgi:alpha-tubulin suppressor-like RCC1 family protein
LLPADYQVQRVVIPLEDSDHPSKITDVCGSGEHFAAVNANGVVYTWGTPAFGRLGLGVSSEFDNFQTHVLPTPGNII